MLSIDVPTMVVSTADAVSSADVHVWYVDPEEVKRRRLLDEMLLEITSDVVATSAVDSKEVDDPVETVSKVEDTTVGVVVSGITLVIKTLLLDARSAELVLPNAAVVDPADVSTVVVVVLDGSSVDVD